MCQKCNQPVESPQVPAFRVQGFEVPREQGGANHIVNRERIPNQVWHRYCIPTPRENADQMTL